MSNVKGSKQSAEHIAKLVVARRRGRWKPCDKCGATMNLSGLEIGRQWAKGKTFSEGHRKKLSESHKGQIAWNKKSSPSLN